MGVIVFVKEKVILGIIMDIQGKYMLKLFDNREYILQVLYMGYILQIYKVFVSKIGKVDFILKEDVVNMEIVVVMGICILKFLKDVFIVICVIIVDEIKKVDVIYIGDLFQVELLGIEFFYFMDQ